MNLKDLLRLIKIGITDKNKRIISQSESRATFLSQSVNKHLVFDTFSWSPNVTIITIIIAIVVIVLVISKAIIIIIVITKQAI